MTNVIGGRERARPAGHGRSDATFVGREAELDALAEQWRAVCAGEPRVALIEGPAGIGKTALVQRFVSEVAGELALRVSGDESETALALGVVDQLLRLAGEARPSVLAAGARAGRPVADASEPRAEVSEPRAEVSEPRAEASEPRAEASEPRAEASEPRAEASEPRDHVRAGTLVLDVLDRLQADGPVVVVLDDAHWADGPSLAAILFAARRLALDRVLLVIAARDDDGGWVPEGIRRAASGSTGCTLALAPLDEYQLGDLAAGMGIELPLHGLDRLLEHSRGNPLHARALLEELHPSAWLQGEPLPAPRSFAALVDRRVRRASDRFRALVQAAAVLGHGCSLSMAAQLAQVDDPLAAMEDGLHADLIVQEERHGVPAVAFSHPLVRASVYVALSPARRAQLHLGAAALLDDPAAALRHRAAAAVGPDAGLAGELEAFACRAAAGGDWAGAAEDYRAASSLSPQRAAREERMLRALDAMTSAGQVERARRLTGEIDGFADSALRDSVLGNLALLSPRLHDAEPLFESAWQRCDPATDTCLAVRIAQRHALHWFLRLEADLAVQWSARGLALGGADESVLGEARVVHALALAHLGRYDEAHATLAPAIACQGDLGAAFTAIRGWLALMTDDVEGAIADLLPAGPAALRRGLLNLAAIAFTVLARAEYASGAWDDALLHAGRAAAIVHDHEYAIPAFAWGAAIAVPAARGDWPAAGACVAEAHRKVLRCADRTAWLGVVGALPAAARGDAHAVLEALAPLTEIRPRAGLDEPGFWPWQELYADALVGTGRLAEADEFLTVHEAIARRRERDSSIAKLARVRGRLEAARGAGGAAEAAFELALEHGRRVAMPYELALTQLAYGGFLRRAGRRRLAATELQESRERLSALGARPALERCERELHACGLAPVKRSEEARGHTLTPPERSVARLVVSGLSNREVAAELVVSVKTVEFHLTRIYSKLGVRSRMELAARAGSGGELDLGSEPRLGPPAHARDGNGVIALADAELAGGGPRRRAPRAGGRAARP